MSEEDLLKLAQEAVEAAATVLGKVYKADAGVVSDGGRDIKTEADLAAEQQILAVIKQAGFGILSEESGARGNIDLQDSFWVVDPLDGTFNFARGLPFCGVSIGFWSKGEPIIGVIHDLGSGETYSGHVGHGAWVDNSPARTAATPISGAVLATGFPTGRDYSEEALQKTIGGIQRFKKVRMLGSAAMMLAAVAAGRMDAYWEESIWLWDVAAGLALVKAAGGDYHLSTIGDDWRLNVLAHHGGLAEVAPLLGFATN